MLNERRIANTLGIFSLWFNWAISVGLLVIVPVISLYISKYWLPLIVILLEILLYLSVRFNYRQKFSSCMRLHHTSMIVLFWSSLMMCVINILVSQKLVIIPWISHNVNDKIPFISILIISTLIEIVTLYNLKKGFNSSICLYCQAKNGSVSERGFLGKLYSQEGAYLSKMLFIMNTIMLVVCWVYYLVFYINSNINDVDRFIFVWCYVILFGLSLLYLAIRYYSLWLYYCQNIDGQSLRFNSSSYIRFIVICGDSILLKKPDMLNDNITSEDKIDTPTRLYLQYQRDIDMQSAKFHFNSLSGISNTDLRFLYKTTNFNTECNIFHYAIFINEKDIIQQSRIKVEMYTLANIKELIAENKVSGIFKSEIERIYKISMAWKTYNQKGNKIYNIKNYKPTFRVCDIKDWDVDYNDISWLFVSGNNADRPFFKIRKFWYKYICGIMFAK